jgi:hypothetical protein
MTVIITPSSLGNPNRKARYAAEFDPSNGVYTKDARDETITWDFQKRKVVPRHYSILSRDADSPFCYLKTWVLEGGDDASSFSELDNQCECTELVGACKQATFNVDTAFPCRYLRLRITGLTDRGDYNLSLSGFEVFGDLLEYPWS